jgi:antibiotic biosynthesis monooxygenase (ABM) superfamily enzyme
MVTYVMKWNILPDKEEPYKKWAQSAIKRFMAIPGIVEFRGYRQTTGSHDIVVTYEFNDFASWAAWYSHADFQTILEELRNFTTNRSAELWGPSPIVPKPIRPGK